MDFTVITPQVIKLGQAVSGTLTTSDPVEPYYPNSVYYADFYRLTLAAPGEITIDLQSVFSPYLLLFSSTGEFLDYGESQILTTLTAGTYYVEASSLYEWEVGPYSLAINVRPTISNLESSIGERGTVNNMKLTGDRFMAPLKIDAGSGVAVSNVSIVSPTLATATFTVSSSATVGYHGITVTTPEGTSSPFSYFVFPSAPPISIGQTITGTLASSDGLNPLDTLLYAEPYKLVVNTPIVVTIDLKSSSFAPRVDLLSISGALYANGISGGSSSKLTATLAAGIYYVDVSSSEFFQTGAYTLSVNVIPRIVGIAPANGLKGTVNNVTLRGELFAEPLSIDAGSSIAVSNVKVLSLTSATATFTVDGNAAVGVHDVKVTTPSGTSIPASYFVFPSISEIGPGQRTSGTLSSTDGRSPFNTSAYADIYKLTLTTSTAVTIDLRSQEFAPQIDVISSSGLLSLNGTSGGAYSQIVTTLAAGTYDVIASSGANNAAGAYTLSINVMPSVSRIAPSIGALRTVYDMTLTGVRFSLPLTISAGSGITISNVNLVNSTMITATFAIEDGSPVGPHDVTVETAEGMSIPASFFVFPSIPTIKRGPPVSGALSFTDGGTPSFLEGYADLYKLVLDFTTTVTLNLRTSEFSPRVYLLASTGALLSVGGSAGTYSQSIITLAPGTYFVVVSSSAGNVTGSYKLTVLPAPAANDLNGDGRSDLIWQHINGSAALWLMKGINLNDAGAPLGADTGWNVRTIGDFNGDGKSDIVWQHWDGSVSLWLMNGISLSSGAGLIGPGTGWSVHAIGDFNGDGRSDIVWRHTDGSTTVWLMNGLTMIGGGGLLGPASGWKVNQVADFNGDGKSDVLLQHSDGSSAIGLMDGLSLISGATLLGPATGWSVTQVGDFNGDGKADIVWQHSNGSSALWLMDGLSLSSAGSLLGSATGWSPKQIGDFNGDGKADILWRYADGSVAMWLMDGLSQISARVLLGPGTGWSVKQIGDYDGDGLSDIVWIHPSGSTTLWLMNGLYLSSGRSLLGANTGWNPVPSDPADAN
jgi:hypothetical protein